MKIDKNNVNPEDKTLALRVLNHIRNGTFVIGNPGLGLKNTLKSVEEKINSSSNDSNSISWETKNSLLMQQAMLLKAGIEGEETLCKYLSKILKYDDKLHGIVAYASLSSTTKEQQESLGYTPDTDTLLVYGKNILIIDAKNIKTKSDREYTMSDGEVVDTKTGKPILEVHSSTHIWENILNKANIEFESIQGCVCIVNNTETVIAEESFGELDLLHISSLVEYLEQWVENKDSTLYLNLLTEIAKYQILKEKELELDVSAIKRQLGL